MYIKVIKILNNAEKVEIQAEISRVVDDNFIEKRVALEIRHSHLKEVMNGEDGMRINYQDVGDAVRICLQVKNDLIDERDFFFIRNIKKL